MTGPLTEAQVQAQLSAWIAAGLPPGQMLFGITSDMVALEVAWPVQVHDWAGALGVVPEIAGLYFGTYSKPPRPVALGGLKLVVFCYWSDSVPSAGEPPLRIEVL